jgi:hypothetical protein
MTSTCSYLSSGTNKETLKNNNDDTIDVKLKKDMISLLDYAKNFFI